MQENQINQKICLLGMYATGKTSLIRRFVHNLFDEKYLSTLGVNISQKLLPPVQNSKKQFVQFNFIIWDIEGTDEENKPVKNYYMGATGAILVVDLTRPESMQVIDKLIKSFQSVNKDAQLVIAGTKSDLCEKTGETIKEFEKFGKERKLETIITSSKTGDNIEKLFLTLAKKMVNEL